ncbi:MAG: hypothetical protein ACXAEU_01905 [Candidatus Hodarchaeales archaeon]|jgi:hypothetical protein
MVLHAPSIHFHLGAWAVTVLCVGLAVLLSIARKYFKRFIREDYLEKIPTYVDRLDFAAHVSGIIGLLGILVSSVAGVLDASGKTLETLDLENILETFSIDALLAGLTTSSMSEDLAFKIVWTIIGMYFFVFIGAIRIYYVNYRGERMYDQRVSILLLYVFSAINGFFVMIVVAGAGGAISYGRSLLDLTPLTAGFLPGGGLMPALIVIETAISAMMMIWIWIRPYKRVSPLATI